MSQSLNCRELDRDENMENIVKFREAFDCYDKNNNGRISTRDLHRALRKAGLNPTETEVQDMINEIDDGTASIDSDTFCTLVLDIYKDIDQETLFKDTFRVFSKDDEGCIPANELKFVFEHLPGRISFDEIDDMINTVDKNGDSKISFSEFRVMMGGFPLLISNK